MLLTPMETVPTPAPAAVGAGGTGVSTVAVARTKPKTATVARTTVPPPPPRATPPSIGIPVHDADGLGDDNGLGALYDLAEQADAAATAPAGPHCPSCRSALDDNAVLCTNCGYDTRTGKSLATTKEAPVLPYATPKGKGKGPVDMMAPQGSFIIGLLVASAFGVVCSILWIVIGIVTGYEIGILATVVGWTVGLGMQIGQKGYSRQGGIAAAIIAVLAITLPKLLLLALVLAFVHNGKAAELGFGLFPVWTILWIFLGVGAAFRTANGSSK